MEKVSVIFHIFFFQKAYSKNNLITCRANDSTVSNFVEVHCKSVFPINQAKENDKEDYEAPSELARLLEHEEKEIQPHQEQIEVINLGSEEVKREVKFGVSFAEHVRRELVELLRDYVDIFTWYY